jgi:hypothetical protein
MRERVTAVLPAFRLDVGGQLVWLAEEAPASAMLGPLALVVSHGARLSPRRLVCHHLHVEEFDHIETISWRAMLGKGEREVSGEEIAALEAEHGPFQAADSEG